MRISVVMSIFGTLLGLCSCTTEQVILRPDGSREYVETCGAAVGWNICYNRANELCSAGYDTLREEPGFNRKKQFIRCPAPAAKTTL